MLSVRMMGSNKQKNFKIKSIKLQGNELKFESVSIEIHPRPLESIIRYLIVNNELTIVAKKPACNLTVKGLSLDELKSVCGHIQDKRRLLANAKQAEAVSSQPLTTRVTTTDASPLEPIELVESSQVLITADANPLEQIEPLSKKRKLMPFEPELEEKVISLPSSPLKDLTVKLFNHDLDNFQGFANIGNSCYLNSVLVALMSNFQFLSALSLNIDPLSGCLLKTINEKIDFAPFMVPSDVKKTLDEQTNMFHGTGQHDAHELLTKIVDICHLEKLFNVFTTKTLTCKNGHDSVHKEELLGLSIDVCDSVVEGVQKCLKSEKVHVNCEECDSDTSTSRYIVNSTPDILVVHLKRFNVDIRWHIV